MRNVTGRLARLEGVVARKRKPDEPPTVMKLSDLSRETVEEAFKNLLETEGIVIENGEIVVNHTCFTNDELHTIIENYNILEVSHEHQE